MEIRAIPRDKCAPDGHSRTIDKLSFPGDPMRRILTFEVLKTRELLAADLATAADPESPSTMDVCNSVIPRISIIDDNGCTVRAIIADKVQSIIDGLNARESQQETDETAMRFSPAALAELDVSNDDQISPIDALILINLLNSSKMPAPESVQMQPGADTSGTWEHAYFEIDRGIGVDIDCSIFDIAGTFEAEISDAGITLKNVDVTFSRMFHGASILPTTLPAGVAPRMDGKFIQDHYWPDGRGYHEQWGVSLKSDVLTLRVFGMWGGGRLDEYNYTLTAKRVSNA